MRPAGAPDMQVLLLPLQTTGVDLVVKTVPVPDTADSVVSGALPPRELSAAPMRPWALWSLSSSPGERRCQDPA